MAEWVLITGASSGIGLEFARTYAAAGYDVVLCARRRDRLEAVAAEVRQLGRRAEVQELDLGRRSAARKLAARLADLGIAVDTLVNNAGAMHHGAFVEQDAAQLDELIAVNVRALAGLTRAFLPGMLERKHGRILNVASVAAFQPVPTMAIYAASKAFVLSFTEALSEELRGTGVTATALCPGLTRTEMVSELPEAMQSYLRLAPFMQGMVMQDADAVAREGFSACERGEVIRVPGVLNQMAMLWSHYQPRWLVRALGGVASRISLT